MRARRGHDRMVIVFTLQLSMQSVSIISKIESLHPAHGEVSSIQHYMIQFVSDFRKVGDGPG
jgi:hypothetical protein